MSTFDFTEFAEPNLEIPLHGVTYSSPPPSVEEAAVILALHARARIGLGLDEGPLDPQLETLIADKAGLKPLAELTLGKTVYDALVEAGESATTINRMGYFGMLYWARGEEYAISISRAMWNPEAVVAGESGPKGSVTRSKSGRRTASARRTRTASTPTTAFHQN